MDKKTMYSLDDIYHLTKGSIYATTIIGHIEQVECSCFETVKCARCELIERLNEIIKDINNAIY